MSVDTPTRPESNAEEPTPPAVPSTGFKGVLEWFSKLRWSVALFVGLCAAAVTHNLTTVILVFGVIVMVMVHEFGHFLTAKLFDMKVTEYFLGFGPKVWSFHKGETEYGVKSIPAGGYVRIIGMNNIEEVDPADEARTYRQHPYWQRIIVVSAGSFMHFVMAFVLLFAVLVFVGQQIILTTIGSVDDVSNSPAAVAGLQKGDRILSVDGVGINTWADIQADAAKTTIGQQTPVVVERNGQELTINVVPVDRRTVKMSDGSVLPGTDVTKATPFIGLEPASTYKTTSALAAPAKVGAQMWHDSGRVVTTIVKKFSPSGWKTQYQYITNTLPTAKTSEAQQTRTISPVGLVSFAHDAARAGWASSLGLLYAINLFVGIFNMTPLLPFDGGHVAIAIYEKIRSLFRRGKGYYVSDFNKLIPVSYAVLLVLAVTTVSSLWLDIVNPAPNPFQ